MKLGAAIAIAISAVSAQDQCFERYQCTFHHDVNGQEYSWDMHQLCRGPGNEYSYIDPLNHSYSFNICGMTSTICAPSYPMYDSHGVAVQTWTSAPACDPQNPGCTDWNTGKPVCCTGQCAVLGTEFFTFNLIDPSNPLTGGVSLVHVGMPPDDADPTNCPVNPATGLARERQLTMNIYCDQGGSATSLTVIGASEPSVCSYVLELKSGAACGVKGDPFDGYRDNPGHSFGFVVLGSVLTIFVAFVYQFGDHRGWWNPIKDRMPAFCRCGSSGSSASTYGGGSYKNISTAHATPIAASAYGTA